MAKRIAVVILNWNGEKMLKEYLPKVIELSGNLADVWVADNASTDNSMTWISNNYKEVKTIQLDKNYGFADGYNKALKQIEAEYYVLLNSDVDVTPDWLQPLLDMMDSHKDIAACQPKLLAIHHRDMFEYAGGSGGYIDRFGYPFCRGRLMDTIEQDKGQYDDAVEIHWATGACLFVRSSCYWQANGLDGKFFAHNEEIDLCWRLRLLGYKIMVEPKSVVYHLGGGTLPKSNPMKTYLNFRNNLTMLYKNLPSSELLKVMFVRFILDYLAAVKMILLDHNIAEAKAVWRGRRDFGKWKREFLSARQLSDSSSCTLLKPYSLLWQYYVKGKKKYTDL